MSPQEVPWMSTLSFGAAPIGTVQCDTPFSTLPVGFVTVAFIVKFRVIVRKMWICDWVEPPKGGSATSRATASGYCVPCSLNKSVIDWPVLFTIISLLPGCPVCLSVPRYIK